MATVIGDNFRLKSLKPNFERDQYQTLAAMAAVKDSQLDDGHIAFCVETGKTYRYLKANEVDATTGRWRVFGEAEIDTSEFATIKYVSNIVNNMSDEIGNKVDKEDGKGLSTNDYTTEEKTKLAGLSGAVIVTNATLTDNYEIPVVEAENTEYDYFLTIGDTVYSITGASGIKWLDSEAPHDIEANSVVAVSVINNLAVWGDFK